MINLLPQSEQKNITIEKDKKIALILEVLVLVFFTCFILILLSIFIYIKSYAKAENIILEQRRKEFENSEIKEFTDNVKSANNDFVILSNFYQEQKSSVEVLKKISNTLSQEIYLITLSYNRNEFQVILAGFSETRSALLDFKNNLEKESDFEGIFFPPSTWLESEDISFNVRFYIKENEQ